MVTFPDDYPNSVRHFLLIGFLAMFIGAGVFFYMGVSRKVNTTMHTVVFFVCSVTAWYSPKYSLLAFASAAAWSRAAQLAGRRLFSSMLTRTQP